MMDDRNFVRNLTEILMEILMISLMEILIGILMEILMVLMMDSMRWPYNSSDCLLLQQQQSGFLEHIYI